jgi:selenocysteine-specific elongation factor
MAALEPSTLSRALEELVRSGRAVALDGKGEEGYLHREQYDRLVQQLLDQLKAFHTQYPLKDGISKEELRSKLPSQVSTSLFGRLLSILSAEQEIVLERDKVRLYEHQIRFRPEEEAIKAKLEEAYLRAGFQPPGQGAALQEAGGDRKVALAVFHRLIDDRILIKVGDDLYLHREAYERAKALLLEHFKAHPTLSVTAFKDLLGISRKYAIPYLEHFDSIKLIRRRGDERIPY